MTVPPVTYGDVPDVDAVAAIIRARTQDEDDIEVGTFNATTRPTGDQVQRLINQAASVVYGATGSLASLQCESKDAIRDQATHWIGMLAAMLVELSYFPEQIGDDRSAYTYYKDLWDDESMGFSTLLDAVKECLTGEVEPDDGSGGSGSASWSFPIDAGGMVGWQTRW